MGLLLQSAWGPLALGGPQTEQTFRRDRDRRRSTQLPLQSYAPNMAPLAAPAAPSLTPLAAAPDKQALAPAQGGGFLNRLAGLPENSLFQMGMSFLGNAQNGGNWAGALQSMQEASRAQLERQRMQNEMRRGKVGEQRDQEVMGRQRIQWRNEDELDAHYRRAIENEPDQQRRDMLLAIGRDGYADFIQNQQRLDYERERNAVADRQWAAEMGLRREGLAIDRENAERSRPLRGPDADLMQTVRDQAGRSRGLAVMGDQFLSSNQEVGTGPGAGLMPWNVLNPNWATLESNSSQMQGMMRPPGSGATSDFEQRLYRLGVPNVDRTRAQNEAIVAAQRTQAALDQARMYFYEDYASTSRRGLLGAEEAFQQSPQFQDIQRQFSTRYNDYIQDAPQQRGGGAERQQVFESLPPASDYREGYQMQNERGITVEVRNGRWVRVGANQGQRQREVTGGVR